jgi:elongation factor Ts
MGKFYESVCLLYQSFFKEDDMSVGKYLEAEGKRLGGEIKVVDFVLYEKGEGLEKREDNFAEEIAKLTGNN